MVRDQIAARGVRDARVLEAMLRVPRHLFVPEASRARAYGDHPLPIGRGQTISQPFIVAFMTERLALEPGEKVLEVGTGSGYQSAVLACLTDRVFSVEIDGELAREAAATLRKLGYGTVRVREGDGFFGWPEEAPFDAVIVTCLAEPDPAASHRTARGRRPTHHSHRERAPLPDADARHEKEREDRGPRAPRRPLRPHDRGSGKVRAPLAPLSNGGRGGRKFPYPHGRWRRDCLPPFLKGGRGDLWPGRRLHFAGAYATFGLRDDDQVRDFRLAGRHGRGIHVPQRPRRRPGGREFPPRAVSRPARLHRRQLRHPLPVGTLRPRRPPRSCPGTRSASSSPTATPRARPRPIRSSSGAVRAGSISRPRSTLPSTTA